MKNTPFARTIDDKDMNDEMRQVERWGDPMLKHIKKKGGRGGKPRCQHRVRASPPQPRLFCNLMTPTMT